MELPNYSRQLLLQLHTLRKEGQFCDCTILVGDDPHRAHKLVLAASSLLFKSVLEGSESISIDPAVVTSQEFSNLLEMVYTGKLPPGEHNLTRVIAAADSLQMFDVAVSCKNILTSLMKRSPPAQRTTASGDRTVSPSVDEIPSKPDLPGAQGEAKAEVANHSTHELTNISAEGMKSATVRGDQGTTQGPADSLEAPSCKRARLESPEVTDADSEGLDFLSQCRDKIAGVIGDVQPWLKAVETWESISSEERLVILDCCKGNPGGASVFHRLLDKATEDRKLSSQTLLMLLDLLKEGNPALAAVLRERTQQAEEESVGQRDQAVGEKHTSGMLLDHTAELIDSLCDISSIVENLVMAAENCLDEEERKAVLECCEGKAPREALEGLFSRAREEGVPSEGSLLKLLQALSENAPSLRPLLAGIPAHGDSAQEPGGENKEENYAASLLGRYRCRIVASVSDPQALLRSLEAVTGIAAEERECILTVLKQGSGADCVDRMLSLVLEGGSIPALTMWRLLFRAGALDPMLASLIQEVREEPGAQRLIHSVMDSESLHLDVLLKHRELILETVGHMGILEDVAKEVESTPEDVAELIRSCEDRDNRPSVKDVLGCILEEQSFCAQGFCRLLLLSQKTLPHLLPLKEDLESTGKEAEPEAQTPASMEDEPSKGRKKGAKKGPAKQCFCQWCGKAFTFMCRMEGHRKRCPLSQEVTHRCPHCPKELPTPRALKQHLAQAHEGAAGKKKKQTQVDCDICGKTFAHPSGMLYHKRTEHFDEKPYVCKECGAKFAANSSLKNHMRLHTGERPFLCKHCDMGFSQAAALSYHVKKKHSEGKMYACQYCEALFAQSIELTRHVRTHTGDKPYVCRECGKGFSQANGLSVHLQTFHNIMNPHDCQKCRMSFPSLEEHRKHIQEFHPKEYHQCEVCSKVFSTAALLLKHIVTHNGKKPYSCKICHKAYQQLSGLWYHNRITHPEVFAGQGSRLLKSVFQCTSCDKAFCTSASLAKHEKAEHPDKIYECEECKQTFPDFDSVMTHKRENHSGAQVFKCLYCPTSYGSASELQQHLCSQHFSEQGEAFGCTQCDLIFPTQPEAQEHFLSQHQEALATEPQVSASQMVIKAEDTSSGPEQVIALHQSQLGGSQVYVALADSESAPSGSEIVAVNVDDLLDGTITFICGEGQ